MRRTKKQRQVEAEHLAQRAQRARYASTVREAFNSTVTAVRVAATFADNLPLKTRWERTWTADDKVSFETSCPASRWPGRERCYGGGLNFGAAVLRAVSTGQSVTGRVECSSRACRIRAYYTIDVEYGTPAPDVGDPFTFAFEDDSD